MTNLDAIKQKNTDILQRMADSIKANDTEAFQSAFNDLSDTIGEGLRAEFEQYREDADAAIK